MSHHGRPPEAAPSAFYKDPTTGYVYIDDELYVPANQAVVGLYDDRGSYDASGNTYPASGGSGTAGAILRGDAWTATDDGGTLNGIDIEENDLIVAKVDNPGQTVANWNINKATGESGGSLALGETSSTAYRGDRGKTAYDHSQLVTGNPHSVTAAQVGAPSGSGTSSGTNTGDQTLPVKATGAEADTGTDDAKFVTPRALADSDYIKSSQVPAEVGIVASVVAGTGIDVDNTDPANPIVSFESGVAEDRLFKADDNGQPVASQIYDDGAIVDIGNQAGAYMEIDTSNDGSFAVQLGSSGSFSLFAGANFIRMSGEGGNDAISIKASNIFVTSLPTSDPHDAGQLYITAGVLMVSAG